MTRRKATEGEIVVTGGIEGGRKINTNDPFEVAVNKALGDRIRQDEAVASDMWCALANQKWKHEEKGIVLYSFRAAGDLVAAIRGKGDYLDWYCCGSYPVVTQELRYALKQEGWEPIPN